MKGSSILVFILLALPLCFHPVTGQTGSLEWSSLKKISQGAWFYGSSVGGPPDITASGQELYVSWMEGRTTQSLDYDLFFTSSQDGGVTWSAERSIETQGNWSTEARLVSETSYLHVFLDDAPDFYHLKSQDKGQTWTKKLFASSPGTIESHSAATENSVLYFAYSVGSPTFYDVWFTRSSDRGENWLTPLKAWSGDSPSGHAFLDIAASDGRVFIVFDGGLLVSADNGDTWGSLQTAVNGRDVEAVGTHVYIAKGTAYEVVGFLKSDDYGSTWGPVNATVRGLLAASETLVFSTIVGEYSLSTDNGTSFAFSGDTPYVVGFDPGTDLNDYVSGAAQGSTVHLVFFQQVDSSLEVFHQKVTFTVAAPNIFQQYWFVFVGGAAAGAVAILLAIWKFRTPKAAPALGP